MTPLDALAAASTCAWAYLALAHGQFWRIKPLLLPARTNRRNKQVVAVIPARDEAESIEATVRSLIHQVERVIVVDDNSTDNTAALARNAGAYVVSGAPLRPGWTGKLWALHQGVAEALPQAPDFLLFTDADIVHAPDSIERLTSKAEQKAATLYRLWSGFDASLPLSASSYLRLYSFSFSCIRRAGSRVGRSTAAAAGGCVLIRPSALHTAGGIEAIRGELIDDCALARIIRRSGGSLWLGTTEATVSTRNYPTFTDVRQMISRTAFTQLRYSSLLLAGTVAGMLILYLVPVIGTFLGSAFAAAAWLIMAAIYAPTVRFYRQPLLTAFFLPAVAMFYICATVESAVRYWTGRGGSWKGRNQAAAGSRAVR